jgi:hypothetical protein
MVIQYLFFKKPCKVKIRTKKKINASDPLTDPKRITGRKLAYRIS